MKEYSLGELVRANRPITYGIVQPGPDVNPNGVPLIRGKDYSSGKVATEGLYHVLPEIDKPYTRSKVEAGDVLLSIAGYVGQIAIVPEQLSGANITQTTARLSCDDNKVISKFLFYVLQSETFYRTQVKKHEKGSAQSGLNLSDVGTFKVDLPPLPQQSKIAKILSTCDDVIEKTEAAIAKYQALKQGMMHDLFTRGIDVKTGKLRPTFQEAPELYKESELGMIPMDWLVKQIKEICNLRRGASPRPIEDSSYFSNQGRGWIRISDVTKSYKYLNKTTQYLSQKGIEQSIAVNPNDIIMSICATIGKPVILKIEACIHDGFVWFKDLDHNLSLDYFFHFLVKNEKEISLNKQIGTQGNLNTSIVNNIILPYPEKNEQKRIEKILNELDKKIKTEQSSLTKYQQLKAGLMQDLLTGKVEVSVTEKILKN
jgi:type I restriction enzyme S subunit